MPDKTILLAGAGGVLGKQLLKRYLALDIKVKAAVFREAEIADIKSDNLIPVVCDVRDPDSLRGICDNCELVVSVVGIGRISGKLTHMDVDYQGNANLLKEAIKSNVKKFAFISPEGTGPNTGVPLLEAKHRFEELLRNTNGVDHLIIRAGGFYSDLLKMCESAGKGPIFLIGSGKNYFTPIDTGDLADFMVKKTLSEEIGMVSAGGPQDLTWEQICFTYQEHFNIPKKVKHIPVWLCSLMVSLITPFSKKYSALGKLILFMSTHDLPTDKVAKLSFKDYLKSK